MNNINVIKDCSACGACVCVCPTRAISMIESDYFYKTFIDEDKCVSCGKCLKVCPAYNDRKDNKPLKAIGGWSTQADVRAKSSSGGAFSLLAEYVLSQKGVVFGAKYTEDCKQIVFDSTDHASLDELRRSKYVESYTGDSFTHVQDNLKIGRLVLFCGTPCQVAGLSNYLEREYDNLILCDFACGGLSSHSIFKDYIEQLEKKYKSQVVHVNFRPKAFEWSKPHIIIKFANGMQYSSLGFLDPYYYCFDWGRVSQRENCYSCIFSNSHFSDITIADYWKYADSPEILNDEKGISLITANTEKGKTVVEKILDKMQYYELDLEKASYNFKETVCNEQALKERALFFSELKTKGLTEAAKSFGMLYGYKKIEFLIKRRIRMVLSSWKRK